MIIPLIIYGKYYQEYSAIKKVNQVCFDLMLSLNQN